MIYFELFQLLLITVTGVIATYTDINYQTIPNKLILISGGISLLTVSMYYIFFARAFVIQFIINFLIMTAVSLILFFSHSWAGGDCKLFIVFAMAYPARLYISNGNSSLTLFYTVCFSFAVGYFYLLVVYLYNFCRKDNRPDKKDILLNLKNFLCNYASVIIYIAAFQLFFVLILSRFFELPAIVYLFTSFIVSYAVGSFKILKNRIVLIPLTVIVIIVSIIFKIVPVSTNIFSYVIVFLFVLAKILITGNNYKMIQTEDIKKGMILSFASSLGFEKSKIVNLPPVSHEDLRSRLTSEQAEAIKKWQKTKSGKDTITIVKKIPFAIFIFIGFISYFVIWSLTQYDY